MRSRNGQAARTGTCTTHWGTGHRIDPFMRADKKGIPARALALRVSEDLAPENSSSSRLVFEALLGPCRAVVALLTSCRASHPQPPPSRSRR